MNTTITSTMREIREKADQAEIKLFEAYELLNMKKPEIRAHMDAVFGIVEMPSKTPKPKAQKGQTLSKRDPSPKPKPNPNFPAPRPADM